jgi:Tol biopolymer transport system component
MKFRRLVIFVLCCTLLSACGQTSVSDNEGEKSSKKASSSQTTQPVQLAQPAQPVQPAKPVQPVQLVQLVQPALPVQPVQSVQSAKPTPTVKKADASYLKKFRCPENGKKILFSSDWNPLATTNFDILSANDDGSEVTRLTDRAVWEGSPSWSPDRCRIVYSAVTDAKNAFDKNTLEDIYIMDADGKNRSRLTNTEEDDREPDWSPDGKKIVFMSERDKNREIYVMTTRGTEQVRLTKSKPDDENPHWSPNNDRIVFSSHRDGNWEVYLMDIDGSNLINLTMNTADDKDSAWSPDGSQIAFFSNRSGTNEIYIMNKDGSDVRQITHQAGKDPSVNEGIAWSPDGLWIGFSGSLEAKAGGKIQAIFKAAVDGSGIKVIVNRDPSKSLNMEW